MLTGKDYEQKRVYKDIDQQSFNWHAWSLVALGFFANYYSLYSIKVILSWLALANWKMDDAGQNELKINIAIITGSITSQLLFGYLADRYDRLKLYGLNSIALTFVNIYFAQNSSVYNSVSMLGLLIFLSFCASISTGTWHPLSSTITAQYVISSLNILKTVHLLSIC